MLKHFAQAREQLIPLWRGSRKKPGAVPDPPGTDFRDVACMFFFVAWCVLQKQNNSKKKKLLEKNKNDPVTLSILVLSPHLHWNTASVWGDGLHQIPVTNRQTERLYWRAVFIMKQYWDQIETVVTWWLIPPLWSLPAGPDTPLRSSSLLRCRQVDPFFIRTASKSSGYRLLPSCSPMSRVHPSVLGMSAYIAHICIILGVLQDSVFSAIFNAGAEW